ncbi:MAG TPA: long-chain fatty acid--CoA ligase [Humibacillus sp.]|nr:long-chain fatty acid--CoA ligase [Humibacillus sp.]
MLNLSILLEDSARRFPERDAVVLGTSRIDYRSLDARANQVANLLVSKGIRPGDKVALSCPNLPAFPVVYYGILKAGAVVVPLNVLLKGREVAYHLVDSEAKAYLCFEGTPELPMATAGFEGFAQAPDCEHFLVIGATADAASGLDGVQTLEQGTAGQPTTFETVVTAATDTAVVLYTSGTTGRPKGAELSHSNLVLNAMTCHQVFGNQATSPDVHLVTLPLFHSFGSTVQMNAGFSVGATLVLLPRFDAQQAVALLQQEHVTFFTGVPTMYWGLLGALTDEVDVELIARNLRVAVSGGASLSVEIITQFRERFGVQILEGYGLSETSPLAAFSDPAREPRPGSIGVPVWGVELKLVDDEWNTIVGSGSEVVGEIAIRGHNVMTGYLSEPQATAAAVRDGWFRTGDLAWRDTDGYYYIVDRAKDMIIRGGFNVYPREIEEVLMTHPAVSLAAVVGVPHDTHGEEVKAFVIPEKGVDLDPDALLAWGREQMAAYKYPRVIEVVGVLPMTSTGKILKRELVAR